MSDRIKFRESNSDSAREEVLFPSLYEELRRLAYSQMAMESGNHTLQPTALVHEAWLRMISDEERTWQNRAYFFSSAANAMRRILVDHARKKTCRKRGGRQQQRVDVDLGKLSYDGADDRILMVDEALEQLESVHPDWAKVVVMKYFAGMTYPKIAHILGISEMTVRRYWRSAKIWLFRRIGDTSG